ncbi:MAG: ribonuclease HII, partial [Deltaproteobacteria bacterium]
MAAGPKKRSRTTVGPQHRCPSWRYEQEASRDGALRIAGIDEAGRGPLAGPVVAAAVILSRSVPIPDLRDSKLLTEGQRDDLCRQIHEKASAI